MPRGPIGMFIFQRGMPNNCSWTVVSVAHWINSSQAVTLCAHTDYYCSVLLSM